MMEAMEWKPGHEFTAGAHKDAGDESAKAKDASENANEKGTAKAHEKAAAAHAEAAVGREHMDVGQAHLRAATEHTNAATALKARESNQQAIEFHTGEEAKHKQAAEDSDSKSGKDAHKAAAFVHKMAGDAAKMGSLTEAHVNAAKQMSKIAGEKAK